MAYFLQNVQPGERACQPRIIINVVGGTQGAGEVVVEPLSFYGPMHYSVGPLPIRHESGWMPIVVGIIPINVASGAVRGETLNILVYPSSP